VKQILSVMLIVLALTLSLSAQSSQCLIVTSAEGHRFRNAMIAGALTGGIGLAAGAVFSGGRYEYRDSFNLPPGEVQVKYKGPELTKLQQHGVHVIVVNKKDKTGEEVKDARTSCQSLTAPAPTASTQAQAVQAPALTPVSAPVKANDSLCLASTIDANGKETCTKYAQQ
jgi:hypothetical protein